VLSLLALLLAGAQFTCFTGTKVQGLTPRPLISPESRDSEADMSAYYAGSGAQFTCFTGTKVQIMTPEELQAADALREADVLRKN
jgi:hypothetical protein